ncbi:peptide ABC transporter substrate-binding protein [Pseudorhodoferax aquiterrae]|uniref:Peptide ABC transporter substrate-binding protein n=1 Tax=Pseudorhodoferax aquiterrae TaxID=747304 RepID=A0ABQ3G245_9BURK|nr:ABC transporter substrate-binding protein [Pseudorhodoferax aquiterrae]GHC84076.1 peptide ABC transporter substrate-binding protein [Pseudorhodoferax aquiterrae]
MKKRDFHKFALAAAAMGLADIPLGITRAHGQTRGGTLNSIVQPEPPMLNLAVSQLTPTQMVSGKIFLSLLTYDVNLKPLPSLAKSWTVSPDGLTYTFQLEPNARWHDGKPLTAEDVVYTAREFLPVTHPRARDIFGRCESITAAGPHTVVFKLKAPFGPFLSAFDISNLPVMPKHIYAGTDLAKNPANLNPVGSGPYKLKEWVRGSHIHLVRNEDYFKPGLPHLDAIIYRVMPDGASRALAIEKSTVQLTQWTDLELFDAQRIAKQSNLAMTTKGYEYFAPIMWLEMNNRTAPMNDKRFRQAVMHAIDRNFIKDRILYGFGKVATGPVNSKTRFYEPDVKKYDFNVAKANALLDEMGLKPDAKGIRARLRFPVSPYGEMVQRSCEYIRQCLSKIGVAVTLESTDPGSYTQRISQWDYDLNLSWLYQFGDPALGVTRNYVSSNIRKILFTNTVGYSNAEVDRLADAAALETEDAKRQVLYSQMQKQLVEDVPIAWLVEMEFPTIHDKRIQNLVTTAIGIHESFDQVSIKA